MRVVSQSLCRPIHQQGTTVSKLKVGKAVWICSIPTELLKASGEPMMQGLHAVLAAISLTCGVWSSLSGMRNGIDGTTAIIKALVLKIPTRFLSTSFSDISEITYWGNRGQSNMSSLHSLLYPGILSHREFGRGLLVTNINLRQEFDSVHRE